MVFCPMALELPNSPWSPWQRWALEVSFSLWLPRSCTSLPVGSRQTLLKPVVFFGRKTQVFLAIWAPVSRLCWCLSFPCERSSPFKVYSQADSPTGPRHRLLRGKTLAWHGRPRHFFEKVLGLRASLKASIAGPSDACLSRTPLRSIAFS